MGVKARGTLGVNFHIILLIFFVCWSTTPTFSIPSDNLLLKANLTQNSTTTPASFKLSKDYITLFFDHRVRYHSHEADNAYTKEDIAAMINVVSTRFNKIIVDTAPKLPKLPPDETSPSRVWTPSVVAQYNKDHHTSASSTHEPPMEVIVTFEFDIDPYLHVTPEEPDPHSLQGHHDYDPHSLQDHHNYDHFYDLYNRHEPEETSFSVARHMADLANSIYPNTVKTLMMTMYRTESLEYADSSQDYSYWQYLTDWPTQDDLEVLYVEHLETSLWPDYTLGIFMDIHDCGKFKGELGNKIKQILPYLEVIGLYIDPSSFHHLTTLTVEDQLKMFSAKFEDCEEKLRREKGIGGNALRIMPSSLWSGHHVTIEEMVTEWEMMSRWAVEGNREVIMYEAFDTPGGREFYYWGHGWWRLKDRSSYKINESSFVEKIEDQNLPIYHLNPYSSYEEDESEEEKIRDAVFPPSGNSSKGASSSEEREGHGDTGEGGGGVVNYYYTSKNGQAIYIILMMVLLILGILVVALIYFHGKAIKNLGGRCGSSGRGGGRVVTVGRSGSDQSSYTGIENPGLLAPVTVGLVEEQSPTLINGGNVEAGICGGTMEEMMMAEDTTPIVGVMYKKR